MLQHLGAAHVPRALDDEQLAELWSEVCPESAVGAIRARSRLAYGARGLLVARPWLRSSLAELGLDRIAEAVLGAGAFPIDAVFLDKRPDANWAVPAHQDVVVAIPSGAMLAGVRNIKHRHGLSHGEPADHVLSELVALRVHFDDAGADTGGLSVASGSHTRGRLSAVEIRQLAPECYRCYDCRAGDVLLMRPLAVHRSGRSALPASRRVLHIVYAPRDGWHARAARAPSVALEAARGALVANRS